MRRMRTLSLVLLAASLALPLGAQRGKERDRAERSVQGLVTDATETPIHKAIVQLKNPKNLQVKSFYTDEKGLYRFHGLDPDVDYELKAEFGEAKVGPRTLSSFDSRKDVVINFKLDVKQ